MNDNNESESGYVIDQSGLPSKYPTHLHEAEFWEALGRAVATFGFLEEVLGRAIFSFTATKPYSEEEIQKAYDEWLPKLECALTDQLVGLVNSYSKAVREHPQAKITNFEDLIEDLKEASKLRNVLCHGSWRSPDASGASVPHFVNRQKEVFETAINIEFLNRTQQHTASLVSAVIKTVAHMGWQFPGTSGPGKVI